MNATFTLARMALQAEAMELCQTLTPGQVRALIRVKEEMAKQAHPDSHEWWRLQKQIAELQHLDKKMEQFILDHFWPQQIMEARKK